MLKRNKKVVLLVALLVAVLAVTVYADAVKRNIEVFYKGITLVVDNQKINLGQDSAGQAIEPFIYNGTTYLPVRAVGEALGKDVAWDGATNTVYIGKREDQDKIVRLNDEIEYMSLTSGTYYWNDKGGEFIKDIAGNEYSYYMYGADESNSIVYPTSATLGWREREKNNGESISLLRIFADGEEVGKWELNPGDFSREITADISGALQVEINIENSKFINAVTNEAMLFDPVFIK